MWLVTGFPGQKFQESQRKLYCPLWFILGSHMASLYCCHRPTQRQRERIKIQHPPLHTHTSVPIVRRAWEMRHVDGVISGKYNLPQGTWDLCRLFLPTTRIVSVCVHVCVRWLFFSFTLPTSMGSLLPRVWPWKKLLTSNISGSVTSWVVSAFI